MANNFLALGTLAALGWVFANGLSPTTEPKDQSFASRAAAVDPSTKPYVTAGRAPVVEARRAPVPLVRNIRPSLAPSTSVDALAAPPEERQMQDDEDRKAAKT